MFLVQLTFSSGVRVLPDELGDLDCLQRLNLACNDINRVPLAMAKLVSLKWLDLSKNELDPAQLPQSVIGSCASMKDCNACAKNVVARLDYLLKRKLISDEEKRKKRVLQEQEAADEAKRVAQEERWRLKEKRKSEFAAADSKRLAESRSAAASSTAAVAPIAVSVVISDTTSIADSRSRMSVVVLLLCVGLLLALHPMGAAGHQQHQEGVYLWHYMSDFMKLLLSKLP